MIIAEILLGPIIMILLGDALFAIFIAEGFQTEGFEFVNPVWFYKNIKVNIFGAIFCTIVLNIAILPWALVYWLYKLCTVGRHD